MGKANFLCTQFYLVTIAVTFLATGRVCAANRYWIGAGGAWYDTANWSATSGGSGEATIPGSSDIAIFDNNSGNCTLDSGITVNGMQLATNYTGTISQGSAAVTVGTGGFYQGGGAFAGGTADIEINKGTSSGAAPFVLEGGTFTSTSGKLSIIRNSHGTVLLSVTNAVFNHNYGHLYLYSSFSYNGTAAITLNIRMPLTVHKLTYAGGNTHNNRGQYLAFTMSVANGGKFIVEDDFTIDASTEIIANGGTIEVYGGFSLTERTAGGTTRVTLKGSGTQYYESGGGRTPCLVIDKPSGSALPSNTTDLNLSSFELLSGSFSAPAGTMDVTRYPYTAATIFVVRGGSFQHNNGTVVFAQTAASTISDFAQTCTIEAPLTLWNLTFAGGNSSARHMNYYWNTTVDGATTVENVLTLQASDTSRSLMLHGGTIDLEGDLIIGSGCRGGTSYIRFCGSDTQTYSATDDRAPGIIIDKADGKVEPLETANANFSSLAIHAGDFYAPTGRLDVTYYEYNVANNLAIYGGNFHHNNGTIRFSQGNDNNVQHRQTTIINHPTTLNNWIITGGGAKKDTEYYISMNEAGSLTTLGTITMQANYANRYLYLSSGTINAHGNLVVGSGSLGGSTKIVMSGAGDQHYTSTGGRLPRVTIDKVSGSVAPLECADLAVSALELQNGDFYAPTGTLDVTYYLYAAANNLTVYGGTYHHNNGTLRFSQSNGDVNQYRQTTIITEPINLCNFTITGGGAKKDTEYYFNISGNGALTIAGDLTIKGNSSSYSVYPNNGTLTALGDITIGPGATSGSTTKIVIAGEGEQIVTRSGGTPPQGHWTIAKPSGTVSLATPLTLTGAAQDIIWQSGNLNLSSNTLSIKRNLSIAEGAKQLKTTIAAVGVAGNLSVTGKASGIGNLTLVVDGTRGLRENTEGETWAVLSNNTILDGELAATEWVKPWRGKVDYTANSGKDITLHNVYYSNPGTTLLVR